MLLGYGKLILKTAETERKLPSAAKPIIQMFIQQQTKN